MLLKDDQGNRMEAVKVFAAAIKFLKDHLMKQLKQRIDTILEQDINWVLTVPAIWNDGAKQFMKEAADKVNIYFFCNQQYYQSSFVSNGCTLFILYLFISSIMNITY